MTMTRRSRPGAQASGQQLFAHLPGSRRLRLSRDSDLPLKKEDAVLGKVAIAGFLVLAMAAVGNALLKRGPSGSDAPGRTQAKPATTKQGVRLGDRPRQRRLAWPLTVRPRRWRWSCNPTGCASAAAS